MQKNQFVNDSATCLLCVWIKMTKTHFFFFFFHFQVLSVFVFFVFLSFFLSLFCCCKVATVLGLDLLIRYLHVVVVVDQ